MFSITISFGGNNDEIVPPPILSEDAENIPSTQGVAYGHRGTYR